MRYIAMLLPLAIFALVAAMGFASQASAYQGGHYSQPIYTDLSNPYLVCGAHLCGQGEMPHPPSPVNPVVIH